MYRDDHTDELRSPDDPVSAAEQAEAEAFATLVDEVLGGRAPSRVATSSGDRELPDELMNVAMMVRACAREVELAPARRDALIDAALGRRDVDRDHASERSPMSSNTPETPPEPPETDVIVDLAARRRGRLTSRLVTATPWAIAAAAAAAALVLALRGPGTRGSAVAVSEPEPRLEELHRSRPADELIGQIPREAADRAGERIDVIYSDRLAGFRDLHLGGGQR